MSYIANKNMQNLVRNLLTYLYILYIILCKKLRETECVVSFILHCEEVMRMLLFLLYILFVELILVTVVAVALFVAFIVAIRKLDKQKNTSLSGQ